MFSIHNEPKHASFDRFNDELHILNLCIVLISALCILLRVLYIDLPPATNTAGPLVATIEAKKDQ
jgi:hypothetical protein